MPPPGHLVKRGGEGVNHDSCYHAYETVTCDRCKRTFVCTPSDDFYCAAEGDHCCEHCLVGDLTVLVVDPARLS